MTQPDHQAFNTDSLPDTATPTRNTPLGFFNRIPRPLLYGSVAAGLIGGIAAWYLVFGNQTTEQVAETPTLTQTPSNPENSSPNTIKTNPAPTPSVADPASNLSRALEVQDIPFLVTTEGSGSTGTASSGTEVATPTGNRNLSSGGLNPFAPIPTPPVQTTPVQSTPVQPQIQQPNPNIVASNPPPSTNGVRIPPALTPTPTVSPNVSTSKSTITIKQPKALPTTTSKVQKPPTLSNNAQTSPGTVKTNQKPPTTNQTSKPTVQTPKTPTVPPTPQAQIPTPPSEPIVITTRPDIRVPTTSNTNLPIAGVGGVLPIAPQIIQKVNPPEVPQIPVVQPQTQPTKPLELPNEGGVITPDTSSSSIGLKPSGTNNSSQVDPLNSTITPVKPQPPVVVTPTVTPPVVAPVEPTRSILNEFITERQLRYLDYVGGPFPQARLEIKGKSVIVGLGETIPDSKVVVKSITASELVLLLGEETLTIPRTDK
jgi:hypothetical protein